MRPVTWLLMFMGAAIVAPASADPASPTPPSPPAATGAPSPPPTLHYADPPAWVLPTAVPTAPSEGGAIQVLLQDQQYAIGPQGEDAYAHSAVRILNESGLAALGTFRPAWNPETDTLTIHFVRIRRGDQVIDALQGGKFITVLRRETNLEKASLDGRLTATQQLEGLRVGDIVETAVTVRHRDPAVQDNAEANLGLVSQSPVARVRLRVIWPSSRTIRWRVTSGLPTPTVGRAGGQTEVMEDLTNARAPRPPVQAPPRFSYRGRLEVTQYASWGDVSRVMAPLFAKAEVLAPNSPVRAEAAKIKASAATPAERASLALALVERQTRYEFVGLDDGGYVPASADLTWTRRYGDCKGKTVLLLALLHELGIEAEPVLVSTALGDGLNERLPQVGYFNHVLVHAHVGPSWYWLDGTRPVDPKLLSDLSTPGFRWGLPVRVAGADLIPIDEPPPKSPLQEATTRIDASGGLNVPAPQTNDLVFRGDRALAVGVGIGAMPREQAEKTLREQLSKTSASFEVKNISWVFNSDAAIFTMHVDGVAHLDWRWNRDVGAREHLLSNVSASAPAGPPKREPGPDQDAPYAVNFPGYAAAHTQIILPAGGKGFTVVGADYDRTVGATQHVRHVVLRGGTLTLDSSTRNMAMEYPASDADAVTRFGREVNDDPVTLRAPKGEDAPGSAGQ